MRHFLLPTALLLCIFLVVSGYEDNNLEDDDFAEFEQFDIDDDASVNSKNDFNHDDSIQKPKYASQDILNDDAKDDVLVEDEDNEFEHFQDPEEFEGFQDSAPRSSEQPKITISKVPITLRPRWDAYWLEGILCCALAIYALVYAVGRAKNTSIALNILKLQKPLLEENFTLVGEAGADVIVGNDERGWKREAEHCFTMWCSGRVCCEGMLLTLRLIKRQDLVNILLGFVRPISDILMVRVEMSKDEGDPLVLCVGQKKMTSRLSKEMHDLSVFCGERRAGEKYGLPSSLGVLCESSEAAAAILDARVTAALTQYHEYIHYIHISDRYCGLRQTEETATAQPPETERVLLANLSLASPQAIRPLLQLMLYLVDKIRRLRLSKEALSKCEKRRQKVAEAWLRGAHAARQEQAAQRREEKRKQEKERILAEDDPEKQRRWELKEQKRQQKRKNPKMKQLKVKAL